MSISQVPVIDLVSKNQLVKDDSVPFALPCLSKEVTPKMAVTSFSPILLKELSITFQRTTIVGALLRRPLTISARSTLPAPSNCGTSTTLI